MKTRTALLAAAAALFSSCLPVPFDLALSQSAATAQKMTRDNSTLLTISQGTDPSAHDFVFSPAVGAAGFDYTNGFVVYQRNLEAAVSLVQYNASSGTYDSFSQQSQTITNPDPRSPPFLVWPMKSGFSYLLAFIFDAIDPLGGNLYSMVWGDPATHSITPVGADMHSMLVALFGLDTVVLGASVSTDPAATYDMVHWLGTESGFPGNYVEFSFQANSTSPGGLAAPATPRGTSWYDLSSFIPNGLTRVTYFYDENQFGDPARSPNRSFASWYDSSSSSWVSYAWWEQPAGTFFNKRLPIDHRLDALLSTGQLLSTEDGTGRLYDRDGNALATFPLGNLTYIAEEYVGGVPRCYFSQCLIYDHTLHFNVYWIRTDQLSTLAN